MKKLLHERLREVEASSGFLLCDLLTETLGIPREKTDICSNRVPAIAGTIADEIGKYYIPRPRFEDGEPVQFGDEYKWADANIRKITGFGVTENGAPYVTCAFDGLGMSDAMIYSGSLKRPAPKVLDADGVEIKVGDVVYSLLHDVEDPFGTRYRVDRLIPDHELPVRCFHGTDFGYQFDGASLTHREPDSLEKLLVDLRGAADFIPSKEYLKHLADRLTAIMERDA